MISATQDDLLQGIVAGFAVLALILLIWIVLHHAQPGLKIDIGMRGWVNLSRPSADDTPKDQVASDETADGGDAGDDSPDAGAIGPSDH